MALQEPEGNAREGSAREQFIEQEGSFGKKDGSLKPWSETDEEDERFHILRGL